MPRFFFHISNGNGNTPDEEGLELADQAAAVVIAIDSIRSMVAEEARQGRVDLRGHIELRDDDDNVLLVVPFDDAIEVLGPEGDRS